IRRQLRITYRVLNVLVSHPSLDSSSVVTGVRQRITAAVAEHVGVDGEGHPGALTQARNQRVEAFRRDRAAALRAERVRAGRLLALEPAQRPQLVALDRMDTRCPSLRSADMQAPGIELDLVPLQVADLRSPQTVAVGDQYHGGIAMPVPAGLAGRSHQVF